MRLSALLSARHLVCAGFLAPDAQDFLLFLAIVSPSFMLIGLPFLTAHPAPPPTVLAAATSRRLAWSYALIVVVMAAVTAISLLDGTALLVELPDFKRVAAAALCAIWALMILSPALCAAKERPPLSAEGGRVGLLQDDCVPVRARPGRLSALSVP
jgi:hypothetical protein